jgi:RNA polymerase sigma-70 factor (ECF subfamily)
MTSVALRFARNPDAADDIVQNAYEKALRKIDQFDGRARLSTWLHRIVVNEALMWLRSERRRNRRQVDVGGLDEAELHAVDPSPDPAQLAIARERRGHLHDGIAQLPECERSVIQRCGLEEASYAQFCAESGVRLAAAKSRAFRGRRRLQELLTPA